MKINNKSYNKKRENTFNVQNTTTVFRPEFYFHDTVSKKNEPIAIE